MKKTACRAVHIFITTYATGRERLLVYNGVHARYKLLKKDVAHKIVLVEHTDLEMPPKY